MAKIIDLTGLQFNRWTVLERAENSKSGKAMWRCQCSCKNKTIKIIAGSDLRNGRSKSCGCLQKEKMSEFNKSKKIDILNMTFGKLTVIEETQKRASDKSIIWKCQCACEKHSIIEASGSDLRSGKKTSCGCEGKSKGEDKIANILQEHNILFIKEKKFKECKVIKELPFDFFLPEYNCLIEYDGFQHHQPYGWDIDKEEFKKRQEYDAIKNIFCLKNSIILIRIPYFHYQDLCIEDLLPSTSNFIYKGENKNE